MNEEIKKKTCINCGQEKILDDFYVRKDSKDGYRNDCKVCNRLHKPLSDDNPNKRKIHKTEFERQEANKKSRKKSYEKNKNILKERWQKWYGKNKEKVAKRKQKYIEENREKINEDLKKRRETDPLYKIKFNIRGLIGKAFKRNAYTKKSRTHEILGCSYEEFKQYIESQWQEWMNWENHGLYNKTPNYGWDLDHIIPLASAKCEEDIIKLSHYTNFQPLCSYINRIIKKDKI